MKLFKRIYFLIAFVSSLTIKAQFTVNATVKHAVPSGTPTGNIYLNITGGSSPFTFSWTPGSVTTQDLTGASLNSYSVLVTDHASNTLSLQYDLGYKTYWTDLQEVDFRNDSLLLSPSGFGNRSAISKNTLASSTDGWAEMVSQSTTNSCFFGFTDSVSLANRIYSDIDFGFFVYYDYLYAYTGNLDYIGAQKVGDVLKIERVGSTFHIKQNNVVVYTTSIPTTKKYKLKTSFSISPLSNIGASFYDSTSVNFPGYIQDIPFVKHCTPGSNNGSISLTAFPTGASHTYSWTNGGYTTSAITSLSVGSYNTNVKDADLNSSLQKYSVGYKTYWTDFIGMNFRNDSLIPSPASSLRSAISKNTLKSNVDGWAELVSQSDANYYFLGFLDSIGTTLGAYPENDIDYGFLVSGHYLYLITSNGGMTGIGYQNTGDALRIERIGSDFYLKQNNAVIFTATISPTKNYKLKASVYSYPLCNIGSSFADSTGINFPNYVKNIPLIVQASGKDFDDGSIKLTPSSGYSYTWAPSGSNSSSITSQTSGNYSVTIKDALNNTSNYNYDVFYKIDYSNLEGLLFRHDSLIPHPTYPGTGWCTALSQNILKTNEDGGISWVSPSSVYYHLTGFLDSPSASAGDYTDIDEGFFENGNLLYAWSGGYFNFLGYRTPGDVLKIKRESNVVKYYVNGALTFSSVPTNTTVNWQIKTAISDGYSMANIGWNYPSSDLVVVVTQTDVSSTGLMDGAISLSVTAGDSPYTYLWSNTATTSAISGIGIGTYSVVVRDNYYKNIKVNVPVNICNLTASAGSVSPVYINVGDPYTLNGTATGGTPTYTFDWNPPYYFSPNGTSTLSTPVVLPPVQIIYTLTVYDSKGCTSSSTINLIPFPYAPLKEIPDGGYYNLNLNKLLFKFDGQYAVTTLNYNVYNSSYSIVASSGGPNYVNSVVVNSGDNRYFLNASSLSTGYYTLEIINEKKEKLYLKFKK